MITHTNEPAAGGDAQRSCPSCWAPSAKLGVGVVGLAFPEIMGLLLDVRLDSSGLLVTRMLAAAAFALGIMWWLGRDDLERISRYAPGCIAYKAGMGVLFALGALAATRPTLPWIVAVVRVVPGTVIGAAAGAQAKRKTTD